MIEYHRTGYLKTGLQELCVQVYDAFGQITYFVEIGSHAGESAIIFAGYFKHVICIDPWDKKYLEKIYPDMKWHEIEQSFHERTDKFNNITMLKMASPEATRLFPDKFFDGIYIDGLYEYEDVVIDITQWQPKVKLFIAGHDWVGETTSRCGFRDAVLDTLGMPEWLFEDGSWMKRL